jgi:hypothetical protein
MSYNVFYGVTKTLAGAGHPVSRPVTDNGIAQAEAAFRKRNRRLRTRDKQSQTKAKT